MLSAYGRKVPKEDVALTHVGPGTPMGELLRRYWQPVALSEELRDLPKRIRVLCEDLVLFRDKSGKVGLLDLHCAHRGTSLEWARVDPDGLRCCYHGWKFDPEGLCIDMPCEPAGYALRRKVRQPAYPVQEFGGLVFAYMGPPSKMPLLPMYDIIDVRHRKDVEIRGMRLWKDCSIGYVRDCNWLQHYENCLDPHHLLMLHEMIAGPHFDTALTGSERPEIGFEPTPLGVRYRFIRDLPNGLRFIRYTENVLPNIFLMSSVYERAERPVEKDKCSEVSWAVPVDNEHVTAFSLVAWPLTEGRPRQDWRPRTDTVSALRPGSLRPERPYEERQRRPDDQEAQEGQRPIAIHALENLVSSDTGVVMLRRLLRQSIRRMKGGRDPQNIVRDPEENHAIETHAWNSVVAAPSQA